MAFYQSKLAQGGRASGRYLPQTDQPSADEAPAAQQELVAKWNRACGRLDKNLGSWTESHLDRLQFPHPLLGNLTVREMLFFTYYHNLHHAQRIEEAKG